MSRAPSDILSRRHAHVRRAMAALGLDAVVVTALPNIVYLTNFTGSGAILVITADRLIFITDFRYLTALAESSGTPHECCGLDVTTVESSYDDTLARILTGLAGARVGFESAHLTVARHQWLERTLNGAVVLHPVERLVESARVCKDEYEVGILRDAAARISAVADWIPTAVKAGQVERDVASEVDRQMRKAGFERPAFETIVASGPNSAQPHARPTTRTLGEGDLVVLDFGGVYASYCVDLTRTISIGRASIRAREVYAAVLEAHDRAVAAVAPGQLRFDIDAAAREALAARGMAEAFGHGTGHGLGIEVHEEPRISRRQAAPQPAGGSENGDAVSAGMVFTIEPGAYFPGFGGVRIEDDVLVTPTGVEVLTGATTELVEI